MINHIAFIMDGNRRYAKKKNIELKEAYKAGMEQFLNFVKFQVKNNIYETSFFALSSDNYQKRGDELKPIGELIEKFFKQDEIEEYFYKNKIKILLKGDIDTLEKANGSIFEKNKNSIIKELKERFNKYNEKIGNEYKYRVNIALNYDGHEEIIKSIKEIGEMIKNNDLSIDNIDENLIKENLYFYDSQAPEVIVRSGNAPRISGFMLWDSKYSEIYLTKKLWPELDEKDFNEILEWFSNIERNFGK